MSKNKSSAILGTFEGECADANITNLNGLDITREVWENVFDSEDYKKAIRLGHLIGFLGHPDDPNCMDFEHACIVMTAGSIDDDGIVHGSFNLVDTPVGRIVKSFIDAGVTFGISVRGAGDIINNSVDPDTFVFRGFDLVTFPAYPDSIPEFKEIAASTDLDTQARYKAVCASIKDNIDGLNTVESVDMIKSHFAKQSKEYKMLQDRKHEIECAAHTLEDIEDLTDEERIELLERQLYAMIQLYLDAKRELAEKSRESAIVDNNLRTIEGDYRRKIASMQRIFLDQTDALQTDMNILTSRYRTVVASNNVLKTKITKSKKSQKLAKIQASQSLDELESLKDDYNKLKSINASLHRDMHALKSQYEELQSTNLSYREKIEHHDQKDAEQKEVLASVQSRLDETVIKMKDLESKASNSDVKNKELVAAIHASENLLEEYQDAYASLYSSAIGVPTPSVSVTASTSVKDLQRLISSNTSLDVESVDYVPSDSFEDEWDGYSDDLVTM